MSDKLEDKLAQRRSGWQWLKEKGNVSRHMAETFSGVFKDQMEILREVDSNIREYASGLPHYLKNAKKSLKQRRYLDVAHFLNRINQDIKPILNESNRLKELREDHIDDFYGDAEHFDPNEQYFSKEAGLLDFFDDRQRAAKILEKIYKNKLKQRHRDMQKLVNEAERTINKLMGHFETLGDHRASGEISDYIQTIDKISAEHKKFEDSFKEKYFEHIAPMVERMRGKKEEEEKIEKDLEGEEKEDLEVSEDESEDESEDDSEEVETEELLEGKKSKIPMPQELGGEGEIEQEFKRQEWPEEFMSEWGENVVDESHKHELGGESEPEGAAEEYRAPAQDSPTTKQETGEIARVSLELASDGKIAEATKLLLNQSNKLEKLGKERASTELLILADRLMNA